MEKFPDTVRVDDRNYPILTDFKNWIKFYEMIQTKELTDREKCMVAMEWFTEEIPTNQWNALKALCDFFCMKEENQKDMKEEKKKKKILDFAHNAPLILAGFCQSYGIMLPESNMHWWEFKSLFDGMPDDTKVKEVVGYRSIDLNEVKDQEEKRRIRKIKKIYDLPQENMSDKEIGKVFDI